MNGVLERERVRHVFEVSPTESGIATALTALMAVLRRMGLGETRCFPLELSVQEALVNALVHGVREQGGRRITLACEVDGACVRVTVQDDGPGFIWAGARAGQSDRPARLVSPGGRGLLLIRAMMSRVQFNHSGNGITMEMDLPRSSRARHVPIESLKESLDGASYPGQKLRPGRETSMQIQKSTVRGVAVVTLEGRFEFGTRNEYKRIIGQVVQEGFRQLVLDVQRVTFLDSSAIGLLLLTDQNFKLNKGSFSIVNPTGYVRQVLELANLPRVIPVVDSVDEAVGRLAVA